jgi:nucleoside-diphosphate-sugar epimerase
MFLLITSVVAILLFLYLRHVERGLQSFPEEVEKLSPHRWSDAEIKQTYERLTREPIQFTSHLPPKQNRRYVIVGGSGLVGGSIMLHLLARGQPPNSIRNIDFRKPIREDLLHGQATEVEFVQADITSVDSICAAFDKPWDRGVAKLPLTVFHNAAVIRAGDRAQIMYSLVSSVNVLGCANTMAAAKRAGTDVFIATSSGSIAVRPLDVWIPPWRKYPRKFVQVYPDPDKDQNNRPHGQYFGNYAESKAKAEEMVLNANTATFTTGCIRPACGIYGNEYDMTVGAYLRVGATMRSMPS